MSATEFAGEVHEYADRWPMRPADEIEAMAASVRERGQRFPIILSAHGVLVDGRNRLRACELAGVEAWFEVREDLTTDEAIVAFIWDANGDRRDMSKGAKAMLAALGPGRADLLSKSVDVAHAYVSKARQVIQWCDDDMVAEVIADRLPLNAAYEQAQQIKATAQAEEIAAKKAAAEAKRRADEDAARLADLRGKDAGLAALVDEGRMTVAEAAAAHLERTRKQRAAEAARLDAIRQANVAVTEAVYRLHLLDLSADGVAVWLADYQPDHAIHPLDRAELRRAISALTTLETAL